jgi:hypothetical protein
MQQPFGIKGVTDKPRAPVVAMAKIGRKTEKGLPEKLDHIIFVKPRTGETIPAFDILGERPVSFLAVFPPDADTHLDAAWKRWGSSGVKCRGDGATGIDRETGEGRKCAGEYNKDHPELHECEYARPTQKNGKTYPPECKPTLTVRLVVPLAGALGLVQLDTGGVESSIPKLWWQIDQLKQYAGGDLAGVAIKVEISPFTTSHGVSYAWGLATPGDEEMELLQEQFAAVVPARIIGPGQSMPQLPPMSDVPEQDVYGLPDEAVGVEAIEAMTSDEAECIGAAVPEEAVAAEEAYARAVLDSAWPKAKRDSKLGLMRVNRGKAAEDGAWGRYVDWLNMSTEQVPKGAS